MEWWSSIPIPLRAAVSSWWELQPSRPNHPGGRTRQNMPAVAAQPGLTVCKSDTLPALSHTRGEGGSFLLSWGIQAWNILKTRFYNFTYPLECRLYGWIVGYFETVLLLSKPIANQFEQHTTEGKAAVGVQKLPNVLCSYGPLLRGLQWQSWDPNSGWKEILPQPDSNSTRFLCLLPVLGWDQTHNFNAPSQ